MMKPEPSDSASPPSAISATPTVLTLTPLRLTERISGAREVGGTKSGSGAASGDRSRQSLAPGALPCAPANPAVAQIATAAIRNSSICSKTISWASSPPRGRLRLGRFQVLRDLRPGRPDHPVFHPVSGAGHRDNLLIS